MANTGDSCLALDVGTLLELVEENIRLEGNIVEILEEMLADKRLAIEDTKGSDKLKKIKSGGRPGMSTSKLSEPFQGPRSQLSPAAILFPQKDFW